MKNVSISLTDRHAAEIESAIASGEYASVSEVVRAALREFLGRLDGPDLKQIDADIAAYLERREPLVEAAEAQKRILSQIEQ